MWTDSTALYQEWQLFIPICRHLKNESIWKWNERLGFTVFYVLYSPISHTRCHYNRTVLASFFKPLRRNNLQVVQIVLSRNEQIYFQLTSVKHGVSDRGLLVMKAHPPPTQKKKKVQLRIWITANRESHSPLKRRRADYTFSAEIPPFTQTGFIMLSLLRNKLIMSPHMSLKREIGSAAFHEMPTFVSLNFGSERDECRRRETQSRPPDKERRRECSRSCGWFIWHRARVSYVLRLTKWR